MLTTVVPTCFWHTIEIAKQQIRIEKRNKIAGNTIDYCVPNK